MKTGPGVPPHHEHLERLRAAGLDRSAFESAMTGVSRLPKEHVNAIQREYIGGRDKWPTKGEALKALNNYFKEREYQNVKMQQVEKASKF